MTNQINLDELSLEQLKSLGYDLLLQIEKASKNLATVQQLINAKVVSLENIEKRVEPGED